MRTGLLAIFCLFSRFQTSLLYLLPKLNSWSGNFGLNTRRFFPVRLNGWLNFVFSVQIRIPIILISCSNQFVCLRTSILQSRPVLKRITILQVLRYQWRLDHFRVLFGRQRTHRLNFLPFFTFDLWLSLWSYLLLKQAAEFLIVRTRLILELIDQLCKSHETGSIAATPEWEIVIGPQVMHSSTLLFSIGYRSPFPIYAGHAPLVYHEDHEVEETEKVIASACSVEVQLILAAKEHITSKMGTFARWQVWIIEVVEVRRGAPEVN